MGPIFRSTNVPVNSTAVQAMGLSFTLKKGSTPTYVALNVNPSTDRNLLSYRNMNFSYDGQKRLIPCSSKRSLPVTNRLSILAALNDSLPNREILYQFCSV